MHLDAMDKRLLRVLKFLVKFNLVAIPLYLIILLEWRLVELQQLTAWITYSILSWSGMDPSANGYLISIPINNGTWAGLINWDCTGWKSILAFFALVMATELPMKRKAYGLLLIPVIYAINIGRIFFMFFYVRTFDLAHYEIVHTVVWSWGLILLILVLWAFWMKHDFTKFTWSGVKNRHGAARHKHTQARPVKHVQAIKHIVKAKTAVHGAKPVQQVQVKPQAAKAKPKPAHATKQPPKAKLTPKPRPKKPKNNYIPV